MNKINVRVDRTADVASQRGTCPVCGLGCFVKAKIVDNVPISIKPDYTSGHPADCPRAGQAKSYHDHPARLNYPMKRVGKRGEGKWERITWEQALNSQEVLAPKEYTWGQVDPTLMQIAKPGVTKFR